MIQSHQIYEALNRRHKSLAYFLLSMPLFAIILYAAGKPSFVVDAYTRRILQRLGAIGGGEAYAELRDRFMAELPADVGIYNEFHALFVRHGKARCRKRDPLCVGCPLADRCASKDVPE